MALSQILHMNVVAYPCAVRRGIVVAINVKVLARANSYLGDERHRVVVCAAGGGAHWRRCLTPAFAEMTLENSRDKALARHEGTKRC